MSRSFPTFEEFFTATHDGAPPYHWQSALADRVLTHGWPGLVDIPTGFGKTSSIAVAVYHLAHQCHEARPSHNPVSARTAPQRIFHVVDRRSIVEATNKYLNRIASTINEAAPGSPLAPVRAALERLLGPGDSTPVVVGHVHGESPRERSWLRSTGSTIVTLTSHQFVSRLLMRGYGVSSGTRSIHAGLAGMDRLVLMDEPHLSSPAIHTILDAERLQKRASTQLGVPLGSTVLLGATVPSKLSQTFHERGVHRIDSGHRPGQVADTNDASHSEFSRRFAAQRTLHLSRVKSPSDRAVAERLAALATEAHHSGKRRVVVFANTVALAQAVYQRIAGGSKTGAEVSTRLITSRFRGIDRRWLHLEDTGVTVTTQCLEVGVDLSFDALVTEACPWSSLVQRLGRLNRDGRAGAATAHFVTAADDDAVRDGTKAVYGAEALTAVVRLLSSAEGDGMEDGGIDVSQLGLALLRERSEGVDGLSIPLPRAGTLHSGLVPVMVHTRPTPQPDLPVDALINGPDRPHNPEILVSWRAQLNLLDEGLALPVRAGEQVSVPRSALARMLASEPATREALTDLESSAAAPMGIKSYRSVVDLAKVRTWDDAKESWRMPETLAAVASAREVVLDSTVGGYSTDMGWTGSPETGQMDDETGVPDLSLVATVDWIRSWHAGNRVHFTSRVSMVLTEATVLAAFLELRAWQDGAPEAEQIDSEMLQDALGHFLALLPVDPSAGVSDDQLEELENAAEVLIEHIFRARTQGDGFEITPFTLMVDDAGPWGAHVTVAWPPPCPPDGGSPTPEVTLQAHQRQVASWAHACAIAAGVAGPIAAEVAVAGRWHDEGKATPSFQAYLTGSVLPAAAGPGPDVEGALGNALAKSKRTGSDDPSSSRQADRHRRRRAGLEDGWRHEAGSLSAPCIERIATLLIRHLIGSHHGWYRPIFEPLSSPDHQRRLDHAPDFRALNDQFGPWGLAYLEAVLRLADWQASAAPLADAHLEEDPWTGRSSVGDAEGESERVNASLSAFTADVRPTQMHDHELTGLQSHPLTGWFASVGVLAAAVDLDDAAALSWRPLLEGSVEAPSIPILRTQHSLESLVRHVIESSAWDEALHLLDDHGLANGDGLRIKNQKIGPPERLRSLLVRADEDCAPLILGLVGDLVDTTTSQAEMPIVPFANNSSYPAVAYRHRESHSPVDATVAALLSLNAGYSATACDGGMDRTLSAQPKANGLGSPAEERATRTAIAPLALFGMARIGHAGAAPLGLARKDRRRALRVPLPLQPTSLDTLRTLLISMWSGRSGRWDLSGAQWAYEAVHPDVGRSENYWLGTVVRRD